MGGKSVDAGMGGKMGAGEGGCHGEGMEPAGSKQVALGDGTCPSLSAFSPASEPGPAYPWRLRGLLLWELGICSSVYYGLGSVLLLGFV